MENMDFLASENEKMANDQQLLLNQEVRQTSTTQPDIASKETSNKKVILEYLRDFVFWLVGILLVFVLIFRVVVVSGPSMRDTLQDGDYVMLISNVFYREPRYGDVIVASKDSFKDGEPIIKRVIATEGQVVDIDFEAGKVFVDGVELYEPYIRTLTNRYEGMNFPLTVDDGCIFVMGDNRNDSKDSRSTEIGLIDKREILGRAIFVLLPAVDETTGTRQFDRIGAIS
ncbi:MAG: signal peptidase I [Oscillospiraceae bacterium]|nr:signal peptidase I [Oscillospiraceae bacterium]